MTTSGRISRQRPPLPRTNDASAIECAGPLLTRSTSELLKTCQSFQDVIEQVNQYQGQPKVIIDLTKCSLIDPGGMLLLKHCAYVLNAKCQLFLKVEGATGNYIIRHLAHLYMPPEQRKIITGEPGDYFLRRVGSREHMVTEITNWVQSVQDGTNVDRSEVAFWEVQISEITTNGFQHGPRLMGATLLPDILLAGKVYPSGWVQLAALDFGSGIPAVIRAALSAAVEGMHDGEVINYACQQGVTSRCEPSNQGAGLPSLISAIRDNAGTLHIVSNNGLFFIEGGQSAVKDMSRLIPKGDVLLSGTLTIFGLNVQRSER